MNQPENFEYDVRIRKRMLARGRVNADGVAARLAALKDVASNSEVIDLEQPALINEKEMLPEPPMAGWLDSASRPWQIPRLRCTASAWGSGVSHRSRGGASRCTSPRRACRHTNPSARSIRSSPRRPSIRIAPPCPRLAPTTRSPAVSRRSSPRRR